MRSLRKRVSFAWLWYDFWVGWFYDREKRVLYVCLIPTAVVKIQLGPAYKDEALERWGECPDCAVTMAPGAAHSDCCEEYRSE